MTSNQSTSGERETRITKRLHRTFNQAVQEELDCGAINETTAKAIVLQRLNIEWDGKPYHD